ncbi:MAG: efflux RND transporter periplasmic adaptor subunit [Bacteroidales bacterium]|nr:efflux RND transporter periplasmic adaptor subunit [Bacteroidales bacterium]
MNKIIFLWLTALITACRNNTENTDSQSLSLRGDTIIINDQAIFQAKLTIDTVRLQSYRKKITSSGIVRAISNNYAEVASPFAGRIIKSYVRLGQHVKVDDPIFEISSPSYFEAGKAYFHTRQEMQLAEKNLRRQKDLFINGVGIEKEVEEADAAYDLASRDFENSVASLSVFRVKPEELVLGQPLIIRSPIAGEIVENNLVLGQYLREDAEPVVIVAELSKVWVVGQLKEKDIESIHESDEVEIRLTGIPEIPIKGKVYFISELLDEETRSVQVFIECANENRLMKPGMYVSAEFSAKIDKSIIVPATAVFQTEEESFVFVEANPGLFVRRRIKYSRDNEVLAVVHSGLTPGENIIVNGGILLLEAR